MMQMIQHQFSPDARVVGTQVLLMLYAVQKLPNMTKRHFRHGTSAVYATNHLQDKWPSH